MTKAEQLAAALDELLAVSPDVEAAAVVSADGLPMASALPPHVEEDRLAAMSAALLTLGERAATGLGKGELAQVFVEAEQGYVILMSAGRSAVLVTVTSGEAKVGLVLFEMRRVATQIEDVMDTSAPAILQGSPRVEEMSVGAPTDSSFQHEEDVFGEAPAAPRPPDEPEQVAPAPETISTWH